MHAAASFGLWVKQCRAALDLKEHAATHDRHCAYFTSLIEECEQPLKSPLQRATFAQLTVEIDNVRQSWHWAVRRRRIADIRRAIPALFYFYDIRGSFEEATDLFRQAADALGGGFGATDDTGTPPGEDERLLLAELLALYGWFAFRHGQFDQARDLVHRTLALLGPQSPQTVLSTALPYLWILRPGRGDYAEAQQLLRQHVDFLRARGDQWGMAFSLVHLGVLAQF